MIRVYIFFTTFALFFVMEHFFARRAYGPDKKRLISNLSLVFTFYILSAFFKSFIPYTFALKHQGQMSFWASLIIFDFCIYLQHVISHKVSFFWQFHSVHHSDLHVDTTTALRFHPFELLASTFYKVGLISIFGLSADAVFVGEILLSSGALFNHANLFIPRWLDRFLRLFIVTPDMHRIHHSCENHEMNSNYGFFISLWDRLFRTYRERSFGDQEKIEIGLKQWRVKERLYFFHLLLWPFKRP